MKKNKILKIFAITVFIVFALSAYNFLKPKSAFQTEIESASYGLDESGKTQDTLSHIVLKSLPIGTSKEAVFDFFKNESFSRTVSQANLVEVLKKDQNAQGDEFYYFEKTDYLLDNIYQIHIGLKDNKVSFVWGIKLTSHI